jgi:WD40 repeat protein
LTEIKMYRKFLVYLFGLVASCLYAAQPIASAFTVFVPSSQGASITALDVSSDGSCIVSCDSSGEIRLWDAKGGKELRSLALRQPQWSIRFYPDARHFISGGADGYFTVVDCLDMSAIARVKAHSDCVSGIDVSSDGKLIVTASGPRRGWGSDSTIKLWDGEKLSLLKAIGGEGPTTSVHFSRDGSCLATTTRGGSGLLQIWDAKTGEIRRTIAGFSEEPRDAAFDPQGKTIVCCGSGELRKYDLASGSLLFAVTGRAELKQCGRLSISPNGEAFSIICGDPKSSVNYADIRDARSGEKILVLEFAKGERQETLACRWSPSGDAIFLSASSEILAFKTPIARNP